MVVTDREAQQLTTGERRSLKFTGATRVAVVGAGYIADFHLAALAETDDVEVVAISDVSEARARNAADRYQVSHVVTDVDGLVAHDVQVAHLTAPPDVHYEMIRSLLDSGIGVFAEKPLALSGSEARELSRLAAERGLPLAVNHNYLSRPVIARLLQRVASGEIGRVEHVRATLSVPLRQLDAGDYSHWMFRAPRNIVFEQAVHPLSIMQALLGKLVSARTNVLETRELNPRQEFHTRWTTAFVAERGTAELYMAFGQSFNRNCIEVVGTDGCFEVDIANDRLCSERKTQWLDFWNTYLSGSRRARELWWDAAVNVFNWVRTTLGMGRRDPFYLSMRNSIQAFHGALRAGEALPSDAAVAVAVTEWAEGVAGDAAASPAAMQPYPEAGAARDDEVVVLGGTGFIGRRVVSRLLQQGIPVTCVVRRRHSLPMEISKPALDGRLRLFETTLGDKAGMAAALCGARRCIHLATGNGSSWKEVAAIMVRGSVEVAEQCAAAGVERLVYVSSIAALYTGGDSDDVIDDGWETDPLPEQRPLYARGKAATEQALRQAAARLNLGLVVVRPGIVLGAGTPMQHSGFGLWVRDNHCVGWGNGGHPLPLVLADDVADALVSAALLDGEGIDGQAINLCASTGLSGRDVVGELARVTGRPIQFHPRPLWLSQAMEIGKWVIKRAGGRKVDFPPYRDLQARALTVPFSSNTAREKLRWHPVEEREAFLDAAVRIYAPGP